MGSLGVVVHNGSFSSEVFGSPDISYIGLTMYPYISRASVWVYVETIALRPLFFNDYLFQEILGAIGVEPVIKRFSVVALS